MENGKENENQVKMQKKVKILKEISFLEFKRKGSKMFTSLVNKSNFPTFKEIFTHMHATTGTFWPVLQKIEFFQQSKVHIY